MAGVPEPSPPELTHDVVRSAATWLDSWWRLRRAQHRVPAVQGAVALRGELLLSSAHGYADQAAAVPLTADHRFRVASHSKTFTAVALLRLAQEEALRLDDPVRRWLPWLVEDGSPVADRTLAELLSHSGGLTRDTLDGDFWQLGRAFPDEAALRAALAPGQGPDVLARSERLKYSNVGYALLGLVVAAAAGRPWAQVVREDLMAPLGLHHTAPDLDPASEPDLLAEHATAWTALSYADHRVPVDQVATGAFAPATGVSSTAQDLVRWAGAFAEEPGPGRASALLEPYWRRLMHRQWWPEEEVGGGAGYGYGWQSRTVGGRRLVGHGGGWPGHITHTLSDPVAGLAVSVCTNAVDGPALELCTGAVRVVDLAAAADERARARCSGADLSTFTGRYANLWGVRDVVALGGRLVLLSPATADPAATAVELEVLDDDTLRQPGGSGYDSVGEQWTFRRDGSGAVVSVRGSSGSTLWPAPDGLDLPPRVGRGSLWQARPGGPPAVGGGGVHADGPGD